MLAFIDTVSIWSIPVIILVITCYGAIKKVKLYEVFASGAKEGINTAVRVMPHLIGMLVAINIFRASGAMDYLCIMLSPITKLVNMPAEVLPMALMRPLSGGGAMGLMNSIFARYGADSLIGRMASVMAGSTDTTFYVLAVYFGSVNIKNTRHALPAGLISDLCGILAATTISNILFG